ncbi:MAG: endolytic transglycosylase MltG [Acidobacteria bacterium]|nr:endolytic transglycosylase MltG [Acidobacteriota bacterium]
MRRLTSVIAAAGLLLLLVAMLATWSLLRPGPDHEIDLEIPAGAPVRQVLRTIHRQGLLPSPLTGRLYLALRGHGRWVHFGHYRIPPAARPVDVLEQLLEGRVAMIEVTVPEGRTAGEIASALVAAGIGTPGGWRRAIGRVQWIAGLAPAAPSLEGFLFPDTYRFAEGTDAETAARHMVRRFQDVWRTEARGIRLWGTPLEVVTLASLVEAETSLPGERPLVAGVFLNRLRRGMLLQCDPTVVYALKRQGLWQGRLLSGDLTVDDPYNTYRYPGLPPGPIDSPGRASLRAALEPAATRYLYFVAKPGGGHDFSATLREHNAAVTRLRRSRR